MVKYFRKQFALSEQGAKDLIKAIVACTLTNISLMFPVGVMYMLLRDLVSPLIGGEVVPVNVWTYLRASLLILIIIFVFEYNQYNRTFLASYQESAAKRISLAERLRKLPLSFFGKKDLSDLTTTIMADCAGLEQSFSHYIPELIASDCQLPWWALVYL